MNMTDLTNVQAGIARLLSANRLPAIVDIYTPSQSPDVVGVRVQRELPIQLSGAIGAYLGNMTHDAVEVRAFQVRHGYTTFILEFKPVAQPDEPAAATVTVIRPVVKTAPPAPPVDHYDAMSEREKYLHDMRGVAAAYALGG